MEGKLSFIYVPVRDIKKTKHTQHNQLGLLEAWREGDGTIAFKLPETEIELMIDLVEDSSQVTAGPAFVIPSVDNFYEENKASMEFFRPPFTIPPGRMVEGKDPTGNTLIFIDFSNSHHE